MLGVKRRKTSDGCTYFLAPSPRQSGERVGERDLDYATDGKSQVKANLVAASALSGVLCQVETPS